MLALTRWLIEQVERPDPKPGKLPRACRSSAARKRRFRARQRDGKRIYRFELADRDMEDTIAALVAYERLSEVDATDHIKVEAAIAEAIVDIGRKWRDASRHR